MTQNDTQTADESNGRTTLVVNPDDIVEALRRNARDRDTRRTHQLRFERPLGDVAEASDKIHVHEEGHYFPPDVTAPLLLNPGAFVADDAMGYPEQWEVHEAAKEVDGVDAIEDVSDETLTECWETHTEVWEGEVRANLKDTIDINERTPRDSEVVDVEYVEE